MCTVVVVLVAVFHILFSSKFLELRYIHQQTTVIILEMAMISAYDGRFFLDKRLVRVGRVTHNGSCGYRCLAHFWGLTSWLKVVEWLYRDRDHAYITQQSKRIIVDLHNFIMDAFECDRENLNVPTHLYLTAAMRKSCLHIYYAL